MHIKSPEGSGAHSVFPILKKKPNQSGELSTMENQNPGSVWSGTDAAVREQQKQDFGKKHDLVPNYS